MNTADKSISMVDVALRRRFEFIAMYPKPELIEDKNKRKFMKAVNTELVKEKKNRDFEIGHSDFMTKNNLTEIINKKTIPLLVEYCRSDMDKVKKIISNSIVDTNIKIVNSENEYDLIQVAEK